MPWTDFSPDSICFANTHAAPAPRPNAHNVWDIPGMGLHSVFWDIMHGLDLGPTQHVIGNVLTDFVDNPNFGTNRKERLAAVWSKIQTHYKNMGIASRLNSLTLTMLINSSKHPQLKSKANQARHLMPVVLAMLEDPLTSVEDADYVANRYSTVFYLCRFYGLLDTHDMFLKGDVPTEAKTCVDNFLAHYDWLNAWSLEHGSAAWHLTIKFHYLKHAGVTLRWINPKFTSCYPFESFVGKVARVAHSSSYGKPAFSIGRFLQQKLHMMAVVARRHSKSF